MAPIPPDRQMVIDDTDKASGQKVLSNTESKPSKFNDTEKNGKNKARTTVVFGEL